MGKLDDLIRRQQVERETELAEAEQAAMASGRERFDLARLEVLLEAAPGSYAEREQSLRRSYYVLQTNMKTMSEFAKHVRELQDWGLWE